MSLIDDYMESLVGEDIMFKTSDGKQIFSVKLERYEGGFFTISYYFDTSLVEEMYNVLHVYELRKVI